MKLLLLTITIFYCINDISSAAFGDDLGDLDDNSLASSEVDEVLNEDQPDGQPLVRQRRFSCDLFSFSSQWATPNHAVCAARCMATGHKGGSCQGTTCHCRGRWWG